MTTPDPPEYSFTYDDPTEGNCQVVFNGKGGIFKNGQPVDPDSPEAISIYGHLADTLTDG